jgi:hypothetical protein
MSMAARVNFVAGIFTHVTVVLARGATSRSNQRNRHQGQNNLLFHQLSQMFGGYKTKQLFGIRTIEFLQFTHSIDLPSFLRKYLKLDADLSHFPANSW